MALFGKKNKKEEEKTKPEKETAKEIVPAKQEKTAAPTVKLPKGNDARSYEAIMSPHITEKASMLEGENKYVFRVANAAGKIEIKRAVEKLYNVHVEKVQVLTMPSKFRQVGRYEGRKPGFKKAIVTLKEGDRIEITG